MGFIASLGAQFAGVAGLAWVKLVFCLLVCAGCAFGGWHFRGLEAQVQIAELNAKADREREERQKAFDAALAENEARGRVAETKHAQEVTALADRSDKLKQEIIRERNKAIRAGERATLLSDFWVLHYNTALRPTSDPSAPATVPAGASKGARPAVTPDGPVDQWDALYVHTENARRWAECRAQLNSLIDFESPAKETKP